MLEIVTVFFLMGTKKLDKTIYYSYDEKQNNMKSYIGYKNDVEGSFNGFIWSFTIFNSLITLGDYYDAVYIPGNCLTDMCPSSCNPSIKINGVSYNCYNECNNFYQGHCISCIYENAVKVNAVAV